jgi:hypothetical protein
LAPRGVGGCGSMGFFFGLETCNSPGFVIFASPQITSTLFFLSSPPTPVVSRPATARERFTMAASSYPTFSALSPKSSAWVRLW